MRRPVTAFAALGLCAAVSLFAIRSGTAPSLLAAVPGELGYVADLTAHADPTAPCVADLDVPLQVELEAAATTPSGLVAEAVCRVVPARNAERIELRVRPTPGASFTGPREFSRDAIGAGRDVEFPLRALLAAGVARATVDIVATAWIEGRPYERGVTWNLAPEAPPEGRVVPRAGRLAVRELPAGRATR